MHRFIATGTLVALGVIGFAGCSGSDKSSVKQETKITTPKGTTTITTEKEIKKTGDAATTTP